MVIDLENHLYPPGGQQGNNESGKICERYWDEKGTLRLRLSRDASNVDKYLQFMELVQILM